jgi:hypothetical protein
VESESTQDRDGGTSALKALGSLRMPDGARERMLAGAERGIRVRRNVRRGMAVGAGAVAIGLVLLVVAGPQTESISPVGELLAADGVSGEDGSLGAGAEVYAGRLRVAEDGRVELRTASGAMVEAEGPASLALSTEQLSVYEGTAMVDGELTVDAPSCRVAVDGRAELSVQEPAAGQTMSTVSVTVFAGTVQRIGPAIACRFEDLTVARTGSTRPRTNDETPQGLSAPRPLSDVPGGEAAAPVPVSGGEAAAPGRSAAPGTGRIAARNTRQNAVDSHAQAPAVPVPAPIAAPAPPPPEPAPSALELELREQTRQYDQALALLPNDPSAAVARFRQMRTRWPDSALREQIDLRVVQALVRLGREPEARREATSFLQRHPRSRQADDMRRIIDAPAQP